MKGQSAVMEKMLTFAKRYIVFVLVALVFLYAIYITIRNSEFELETGVLALAIPAAGMKKIKNNIPRKKGLSWALLTMIIGILMAVFFAFVIWDVFAPSAQKGYSSEMQNIADSVGGFFRGLAGLG